VELRPLGARDEATAQALIRRHVALTGSPRGAEVLAHWDVYKSLFKLVTPRDAVAKIEAAAEGTEEPKLAARAA